MYNQELAHTILRKLNELFPTPTSSDELRKSQVQGFEGEPKAAWLGAIDALLKLGSISGRDLRGASGLEDAANLVITARGQEELRSAARQEEYPTELDSDSNLVFLSHAARDQDAAIALKRAIESAIPKSDVFVSSDTEDLHPGEDWVETIQENLRRSKVLILLASERGLKRPWVWYESGAAWHRKIPMIPCCIGKVRKNQLPAPFSSRQAVNADEARDLGNLLNEIGLMLRLDVAIPDLHPIVSQLRALDETAHEADADMLTPEEIQLRVDAMTVSAKITRGNRQWFVVGLTNESSETVTALYIQLFGPDHIQLTERFTLPLQPEEKRTLPPTGTLQIDTRFQSEPASRLASLGAPVGLFTSPQHLIRANITIEVGCVVLGKFKRCETNRQVQVDTRNHQIVDVY